MSLSTLELSQMRHDQDDYLPDTCTIQVPTEVRTSDGGFTVSYANTYTSVACRLSAMRSDQGEQVEGEQLSAMTRWILTIAHDQTIAVDYRVVHDSTTYEVAHVEDTHSHRTARRVYLRRLD